MIEKKKSLILLAFLLSLCIGAPVLADPITLGTPTVLSYDQQDWPVFIGYSSGNNQGFGLTTYSAGGSVASGSYTSPTYAGNTLAALINGWSDGSYPDFNGIGLYPSIAIDINQSGSVGTPYGPITLHVYINGADAYVYSGTLNQMNTGNGDSDWVIPGLNLTGATSLYFTLQFAGNNDGKENFFLVKGDTPTVPEPTTLLLVGLGLVGLASVRRYKK